MSCLIKARLNRELPLILAAHLPVVAQFHPPEKESFKLRCLKFFITGLELHSTSAPLLTLWGFLLGRKMDRCGDRFPLSDTLHMNIEHTERTILHVDMDAFYASVEIRDDPKLKGRPVVVGGSAEGRGVVAAASYEARKYRIHSAMPSRTALRLCPHAIFIRPRHDYYGEVSKQIRAVFERYTPLIEPLSLDEAFLDVSGSLRLWGSGPDIGQRIKREIRDELDLVASVGLAPNKFLAKLASDLDKPDGFVVVDPDRIQPFLDPLPVSRLWGVGRAGEAQLRGTGIRTILQVRETAHKEIRRRFGEWGHHIWELAHGHDDRPVISDSQAKSLSHETTFAHEIDNLTSLRGVLLELTEQVARRLRRTQRRARIVEVKIRHASFKTITRQQRLSSPTHTTTALWRAADTLLKSALPADGFAIRLLGMGVSGLDDDLDTQLTLFRDEQIKHDDLDRISDQIKDRFGEKAVRWGFRRP